MKLKRREKILAGVTLGLVGLGALYLLLFAGDGRSNEQLITDETKLDGEIKSKQNLLDQTTRDAKRLADWKRRALPADTSLARSKYQDWLLSLAARANLRGITLTAPVASARREQFFTRIPFNLHAQAKLGDLVQFMYEFYSAGFLQQIRDMTIKPVPGGSRELDVKLTIEALSLPTADSKDRLPEKLPKDAAHGLQLASLSDYREPIVSRDFFAAYVPARLVTTPPPPPPPPPPVDPADFAIVTAFTEVDGAPQVWLKDSMARPQGKTWQLGIGEGFSVGKAKGTVQSILPDGEVIVDFDGHRRMLHMGDNLHGGVEIKDQKPKQPEEGAKSTAPTVRSKQLAPESGTIIE